MWCRRKAPRPSCEPVERIGAFGSSEAVQECDHASDAVEGKHPSQVVASSAGRGAGIPVSSRRDQRGVGMGTVGSVETVHETNGAGATVKGEHTSSVVMAAAGGGTGNQTTASGCEGGERNGAHAGAEAAQQADRSSGAGKAIETPVVVVSVATVVP